MVGLEGARLAERRDAVIVLGVDSVTDDNNVVVGIESGRAMDDGPSNDGGIELMDLVEVQWTQRLHYRPLALALHAATSKKSKRALFTKSWEYVSCSAASNIHIFNGRSTFNVQSHPTQFTVLFQ